MAFVNMLEAKLRATNAFIDYRPSLDAVVTPRTKVPDTKGGFTWTAGTPVPVDKARFVPQAGTNRQLLQRVTADGTVVTPGWYFVCLPTTTFNIGDHVVCPSHSGAAVFEVVYIHFFPNERMTAELWRMQ